MYFHMNYYSKKVMKSHKKFKVKLKLQRYFVICIWSSLKLQQIIKQTGPNRQFFKKLQALA